MVGPSAGRDFGGFAYFALGGYLFSGPRASESYAGQVAELTSLFGFP
jgi:hypothetical protein